MPAVVVYDQGAVSPTDILRAAASSREIIVVLAGSAHAQRMRPLFLETCAAVHDLADDDLAKRLEQHQPDGIITFSEHTVAATSELAAALGLPYHDAAVTRLLTSKDAQRRRLREAGTDRTGSVAVSHVDQWGPAVAQVGLPAVVKPVRGVSSRNTVLVHDVDAGRALLGPLLREEGVVVVEEYLRGIEMPDPFGDYVSVETIVQHGDRQHLAVTGKLRLVPPFRECGQFWPAQPDLTAGDTVTELADQAIKALDVTSGILHTEIKLTPDGPRIIEVNGRVGGYIPELARHAASIDLVDVGIRIACGERVVLPPVDPDRIFFQFTTPAPVEPGVVTKVCPPGALANVPGVVRYHPFTRPGAQVGGIRTHDLDLVAAEAADHEVLASTIAMILDTIVYEFETESGATLRSARDLVYRTPTEAYT